MTTPILDRRDAFATLGTDVSQSGTAHQALIDAGLAGMNIVKVPVSSRNGRTVPGAYLLEDATGEPLPKMVVGNDFTVVQYEDTAATLDAVAARTGAVFDRSGALDVRQYGIGGARAFISMRLPERLSIGGDIVDAFLVAFMSHGWNSNVLAPTGVRVECANQQPQFARGDQFKIVIRHTTSALSRTAAAEEALVKSVASMRRAAEEAEGMLRVKTTAGQFEEIVSHLYPLDGEASKATKTRHANRLEQLTLIRHGDTNAGIRGTAWGDYQAILEYGEWHQRVQGGDDGTTATRARRALTAPNLINAQLKAFDVVREVAHIN